MNHIAPSMLCADQVNLERDIRILNGLKLDWLHLDIMDGSYVPNFAFGADVIRAMAGVAKHSLYAHVMAVNPQNHIESFAQLGVDTFCFHLETTCNPYRLCTQIRAAGMKPAVALNPSTSLEALKTLAPYVEAVTLMSVEPGFSGQSFLPFMYERIKQCRKITGPDVIIEVDGGINNAIAVNCIQAGCDVVVGGYFTLFTKGKSIEKNYQSFTENLKVNGIDQ